MNITNKLAKYEDSDALDEEVMEQFSDTKNIHLTTCELGAESIVETMSDAQFDSNSQILRIKSEHGSKEFEIDPLDAGTLSSYRLLQIDNSNDESEEGGGGHMLVQEIAAASSDLTSPLLTTTINGQLYIVNTGDATKPKKDRAICPRAISLNTSTTHAPRKRDEKRRATHNEVERRRRDKINNWITKLSKIIPDGEGGKSNGGGGGGNGTVDGQSKGGILARACEYIMELRQTNERLSEGMLNLSKVQTQLVNLTCEYDKLKAENSLLKQKLNLPPDV